MVDLSVSYMGLKLPNPILVGSCDLTGTVKGIANSEAAGAGGVVLKSIFEEQFASEAGEAGKSALIYPEAIDYLERGGLLEYASQKMCQLIEQAKKEVKIPILASINCQSANLWPKFARHFEDAGTDALELNIYFLPFELTIAGADYERSHVRILEEVKKTVSIPVSVKLSSQLTSVPHLSHRLAEAGCRGLVFFNWFLQPDLDVARLKTRNVIGKGDFSQSLRWIALCAGRVGCDIAASGGVGHSDQVIKLLLAGAAAVQVATLVQMEGPEKLRGLLRGLEEWMERKGYASVDDFRGEMSFARQELDFKEPLQAEAYFRAQYVKTYLGEPGSSKRT